MSSPASVLYEVIIMYWDGHVTNWIPKNPLKVFFDWYYQYSRKDTEI